VIPRTGSAATRRQSTQSAGEPFSGGKSMLTLDARWAENDPAPERLATDSTSLIARLQHPVGQRCVEACPLTENWGTDGDSESGTRCRVPMSCSITYSWYVPASTGARRAR
jgi:hypothetical protein